MRTIALEIPQGGDYTALLNVTHQGSPFPLEGFYTAAAQLRRGPADSDSTIDATFTCTVSGNIVMITLAHTVTAPLSGAYVWDCWITEIATGLLRPIASGPVQVKARVTV